MGEIGAVDIGVEGGNGMGCLGARGESGSPTRPGLGDRGGEATEEVGSRGNLGVGAFKGRSLGRGLKGRPGLTGGLATTVCSSISEPF